MEYLDFRLPAGGFSGPLSMWLACHRRLDGVCTLLQRLSSHLADFGNDDASRVSAAGIRRYFNIAAVRHQDDEDVDLFPCLLHRARGRRLAAVRAVTARLQDEHGAIEPLWRRLDGELAQVERGEAGTPDQALVGELVGRHRAHGEAEETSLLELMRSALLPPDLSRIGEAMARRRGLTWAQLAGGAL